MNEITWFDEHKTCNLITCISAAKLQLAFCAWLKAVINIRSFNVERKLMTDTFLTSFLLVDTVFETFEGKSIY